MSTHDFLAKAVEIRDVAATVSEPQLKAELLTIAARFERLALEPSPAIPTAAFTPEVVRFL
jgi:hypothetical protein